MATMNDKEPPEQEILDPAIEEDDQASTDVRYQVSSYGADYPVDGLVKRLRQADIELPAFQRDFVWPLPQASRFVESLLLGLPVPAIFLSKEPDTQKLLVIDGQQRLKSLLAFYDGLFRGKEFKLTGVNEEFEGLTYKTLADADRRRLDDAILHSIIIRQEDPKDDDSSVYLIFERLNTTSTPLSSQEIRACVYHGRFSDYLDDSNKNPDWRGIFGPPNLRQKDKELLLRFLALFLDLKSYSRPMKVFLSDFMRKNRDLQIHDRKGLDAVFLPTVAIANSTVGPKAFRPQRALNASVTDAILVGTARRLAGGPIKDTAQYAKALQGVLADPGFMELYASDTTSEEKVRARIARIADCLVGVT